MVLFGSLELLTRIWLFWTFLSQYLTLFGPNLTSNSQYYDFLFKIHTQCPKRYRKVVSFDSLGLLIRFWPFWVNFGPNLAKMGQI